jgi:aryl-alcohol dehydrogenase-like predicted oxidoreductase
MEERGNRDGMVVATKVGKLPGSEGLSAANIRKAAEASLQRLRTDHIDLYYAHADDEDTPLEETLGAFDALVREGKVRYIAASNYTAPRLAEALAVSEREGLAAYVALQPEYNLMERGDYENGLRDLCAERELACVPYFALASGFLTGKYRPGDSAEIDTRRGGMSGDKYVGERGEAVLRTLDEVAGAHDAPVPAVALAWLAAQDTVAAPIASARTPEQLDGLLALDGLELTRDEVDRLTAASS